MPSIAETLDILATAAPTATNNDLLHNTIAQTNATKTAAQHVNGTSVSSSKPYAISLPHIAVTVERAVYQPTTNSRLRDPGTARVNVAATEEHPDGTPGWAEEHQHQTVLQQHCQYWDADNDGIIYPWDLYNGCRAWGWNPLLCVIVVLVIAPAMSYPTLPAGHYLPSPLLPIHLSRIHKNKHGSSTTTYDTAGRFRPQAFEDLFAAYDAGHKGGLDLWDLARVHRGQRLLGDPFGWFASFFEWLALYLLVWPRDGIMRKEDVRASYDGSLFQRKADEWAARGKGNRGQ